MPRIRTIIAALFAVLSIALVFVPSAAHAEKRIALVVGNAAYQAGTLNTPANDAGLIAQTLQAAGFDVVGARDLDQDSLRRACRDFLEKATSSGPDTVAFIYLSGYGVQLEGENYFVPIDAKIARDADVTAEALRVSDYTRPLAALKLKSGIVVLDTARANPFAKSGPPLAGGLAMVEPEPGLLIAFNAAPGTVAPEGQGPYGPYAQALAEMMREGGLPLTEAFDRARLRVNDVTKGAEVPWHASKIEASLAFFERASDAPAPAVSPEQTAAIRSRPIRELAAQEAYIAALERDTLDGYSEFLAAYADDPMAKRVRAIVAARREALTWRRTRVVDTPPAYWSYLRRYPQGPHAADAHRRLAFLAAALEPPPSFAVLAYDLPPPPPEEMIYIRRPVLVFDDPSFAFAPPPPPPVVFLAPPPPEFVLLPPPPPPVGTLSSADAGVPTGAGVGSSAGLRGTSSTEQCDLQQRPQHGRHQQCDKHRDDYQSKWPDADLGAAGSARCTAARSARRRCACPRSTRAGAAAFRRAEGRHASEPNSARHPRTGSEATAGAAQAAAAGYAGTAFAAGDRYSCRAGSALGRDPARHTTGTRQGAGTNNISGHGYARDACTGTGCEAGNAAFPGTGRNDGAGDAASPPTAAHPVAPSPATSPAPAAKLTTPPPSAKPVTPPPAVHHAPARPATTQPPAAAIKPVAPSPPPAAKLTTPSPAPPPSPKPATPPPAPAAAAARPAPGPSAPAPKVVQPLPKGCPPGKTMAVVNGHPSCK